MKLYLVAIALCLSSTAAFAAVEPNYAPDKPPLTTPWFATQTAAERQADLDFIAGMRPHHAGALTMSEDYLKDPKASDTHLTQLARGIIHNQKFEIGMLDRVEELVGKPLAGDSEWRQIAEKGLAQKQRFTRAPMPGPLYKGNETVTARDVQFAKAMVVHHEGALTMCNDYLNNPAATNRYLRLLCVDILTDQKQEIAFMNAAVKRYPGNPDDVIIDASMIHGMEGMKHGGGHTMHHEAKPKRKAEPAKKASPMDHGAMGHSSHSGH
jgi:uncharacterized protein (DUF305 family)